MDFIVTVDTVQPFSMEHGILTVRIELLKNLTKFDSRSLNARIGIKLKHESSVFMCCIVSLQVTCLMGYDYHLHVVTVVKVCLVCLLRKVIIFLK